MDGYLRIAEHALPFAAPLTRATRYCLDGVGSLLPRAPRPLTPRPSEPRPTASRAGPLQPTEYA
jgi:hypothetical protein